MPKINFSKYLLLAVFLLNGCATYEFQRGLPPLDKGYVASRDGYAIAEYTIGKDNSVPNLKLAGERFKRRRQTVEYYYKKMGYIENRFKENAWDRALMFPNIIKGVFSLPVLFVSDYRYEHSPKYKERIDKHEEELKKKEELMSKKKTLDEKLVSLSQSANNWLEPMRKFIDTALQAEKIASEGTNLFEKRDFLKNTHSNLTLKDKTLHCNWQKPWSALCADPTIRNRVPLRGIEPLPAVPKTATLSIKLQRLR